MIPGTGRKLPCGGVTGDYLHHEDGTPRGTARSANGRELERFDRDFRAHAVVCEPCPSCGKGRRPCVDTIRASKGRACCVHCAEAPLAETHRGPR